MFIRRNIPNAITLGNLLCGCLAIVKAFEGDLVWAAYLVGIAAVLDYFDGFAARLLGVSSPIGKDLDSLADMVTFGVVPGVIMFKLTFFSIINQYFDGPAESGWTIYPPLTGLDESVNLEKNSATPILLIFLNYVPFIIPVFSAIRLAKFNNDTRQSESFIGLPTPANAILICSLPLIRAEFIRPGLLSGCFGYPFYIEWLNNTWCVTSFSVISAFLLVAPIPLFALKFKNFGWKGNEIRYIFLIWSVLLLVFLQFIGIPLVIISYIIFSLVHNLLSKKATA